MIIPLRQRGDTIVEVLIAVAVVSMVVASAYAITNRNLANTRQAQEHSEASKLGQAQIEQLRVYATQATQSEPPFSFVGQAYCISSSGSLSATFSRPAASSPDTDYNADCRGLGSSGYRVYIFESGQVFEVNVTWSGSRGQQQVQTYYKAFPNVN